MKEIRKEPNERFWRINEICKLIAKTPLSTSQIADKLGVSERTIQRDLNGVLVKYGAVRNGRLWSIDENKIDPKDENQIILAVLDKMAKNVGAEFYSKAHGLLKGISEGLNHPIFVSLSAEKLEKKTLS